ncbi:dTMP kinase [Paucibacter sp. KCTC 42545]|uniref:dTMP kinase n=1 Tax=Paucibacter sp. KCTC 42545 TaxID=1768242 RepID=UPI000733AC82|nr:dTMP kinase [Paucibacter sp. KCTC 42545]ALT77205.1 thymidylate kinase [Paucibacter sp. KCTC 42545]
MNKTSRFITFEGIDGAGKSTHIARLGERLSARGASVLNTREPGGTPLAETLRGLFLHSGMDGLTEALLVFAGRRDHLRQVIEPALQAGQTVLCDRFTDATFAYQGGGRGMDLDVLATLEQWVQEGRQPDLTFWFDLPAEQAAQRRAAAREADRFEQQDLDFFNKVRAGYAARAAQSPERFARIDASLTVAEVAAQIEAVLEARGW